MENKRVYIGLDVGQKRIGVAIGDSIARIAQPIATIEVNDSTMSQLFTYIHDYDATDVIVGRPRNQSGDTTKQTRSVETFVTTLQKLVKLPVHWQDESVTSVIAEERLQARKKPYSKADIDAEAAAIILQDFLETI